MILLFKIGNRLMRLQVPSALLSVALTSILTCASHAQEITIDVHADQVLHTVSPHLTGACIEDVNHEIYGGIYSQMIFGESFQEPFPSPALIGFKAYGGQWLVVPFAPVEQPPFFTCLPGRPIAQRDGW